MSKAIKITPDCKVIMVDDWRSDPDYIGKCMAGYSLSLPQFWKHKLFYLSVFMLDIFEDHDIYNPLATMLFRKLKSQYGSNDEVVCGALFICNEDDESELDFTLEDYEYILSKLHLFKYNERYDDVIDWNGPTRAIDFDYAI